MTEKQRLIRARIAMLNLAAEVKNVAKACKLAGVSRSQFYAMKKAYETYGEEGLVPRIRRKPDMPNRTPSQLEESILSCTRRRPTFSYIRLAREMNFEGLAVSPTMIRYVWQRHGLSTRSARLEWLNKSSEQIDDLMVEENSNEPHTTAGSRVD
jgi:transposase